METNVVPAPTVKHIMKGKAGTGVSRPPFQTLPTLRHSENSGVWGLARPQSVRVRAEGAAPTAAAAAHTEKDLIQHNHLNQLHHFPHRTETHCIVSSAQVYGLTVLVIYTCSS